MHGILYMNTDLLENKMLFDKGMSLISTDRRNQILTMKNPVSARLSMGAGILLRLALERYGFGEYLNDIKYGKFGKPYIENIDFHFSLSHSGNYVICAYSDVPIGADLQIIKTKMPVHTSKILSDEEKLFLETLNETDRTKLFFQLWAKKESLIKWDGRGLRLPLHHFSFIHNNHICDSLHFQGKQLYFKEITILMPAYAICICSEQKIEQKECTEITEKFLTKY